MRINEDGGAEQLTSDEILAISQNLRRQSAPVTLDEPKEAIRWHKAQLQASQSANYEFATRFHLKRLHELGKEGGSGGSGP